MHAAAQATDTPHLDIAQYSRSTGYAQALNFVVCNKKAVSSAHRQDARRQRAGHRLHASRLDHLLRAAAYGGVWMAASVVACL